MYGHQGVSLRNWFQDPLRTPKSVEAQVFYIKWYSICKKPMHFLLYTLRHL